MKGKFVTNEKEINSFVDKYLPIGFITVTIITVGVLLNYAISSQDKLIGAYKISKFSVNGNTLEIGQGKFTKVPMLFFEFNNGFVLSLNDSSYYGSYSTKADSVYINLYRDFKKTKALKATIDSDRKLIKGFTDNSQSFEIKMDRVKKEKRD